LALPGFFWFEFLVLVFGFFWFCLKGASFFFGAPFLFFVYLFACGAFGLFACGVGLSLFCVFGLLALPFGCLPHGVGLSLFSCRSICTAPVRGGTYFLCGRQESRQRKRLTPPAFRCPPLTHPQSGPRSIRPLAHSPLVTQQSSTPLRTSCVAERFARESGCRG
jgi:hypothetical protein